MSLDHRNPGDRALLTALVPAPGFTCLFGSTASPPGHSNVLTYDTAAPAPTRAIVGGLRRTCRKASNYTEIIVPGGAAAAFRPATEIAAGRFSGYRRAREIAGDDWAVPKTCGAANAPERPSNANSPLARPRKWIRGNPSLSLSQIHVSPSAPNATVPIRRSTRASRPYAVTYGFAGGRGRREAVLAPHRRALLHPAPGVPRVAPAAMRSTRGRGIERDVASHNITANNCFRQFQPRHLYDRLSTSSCKIHWISTRQTRRMVYYTRSRDHGDNPT